MTERAAARNACSTTRRETTAWRSAICSLSGWTEQPLLERESRFSLGGCQGAPINCYKSKNPTAPKPCMKLFRARRVRPRWNTLGLVCHERRASDGSQRALVLSKNVIKVAWREGRLSDLPAGTLVGVDAAGWLHKACIANAKAICLLGERSHQQLIMRPSSDHCSSCSLTLNPDTYRQRLGSDCACTSCALANEPWDTRDTDRYRSAVTPSFLRYSIPRPVCGSYP